jgi:prepilin-type N-terminal cleavage/methylation domain-containing protein
MKIFKKSGFTLIEALVAISILMIAIASPMQLAQKGLSTGKFI